MNMWLWLCSDLATACVVVVVSVVRPWYPCMVVVVVVVLKKIIAKKVDLKDNFRS